MALRCCCRVFGEGKYLDAFDCYTAALKLCPSEDEFAYNRVSDACALIHATVGGFGHPLISGFCSQAVFFSNRAACLLRLVWLRPFSD